MEYCVVFKIGRKKKRFENVSKNFVSSLVKRPAIFECDELLI